MKKREWLMVIALILWALLSLRLFPPRKWEDLTPEELLRYDIDATALF